jgi:transcriptional regulator with XRE-family HTH domain
MGNHGVLHSTDEWEQELGRQVRGLRIRLDQTQEDLARAANVSVSTIQSLERGQGSSLATLIQVVRALGREGWLNDLAPTPSVSPMQLLRDQRAGRPRQRVRRRTR